MVAAYWLQLQNLRKSTTGEKPSIDGLSPFYIFFHGIYCNSQLSFALINRWEDPPERLAVLDLRLRVAQVFAQWSCAMTL
jgi:hypothetical protein